MVPLRNLIVVFTSLIVIGTALTIPLFKFNYRKFFRSSLFLKIIFWIPIFTVFIGLLYAGNTVRAVFLGGLLIFVLAELLLVNHARQKALVFGYYILFAIGLGHFYLIGADFNSKFVNILITLALSTVLADVAAFFLGNYAGRHKLPARLNDRKSWEGVFGEILGALGGVLLVNYCIEPVISIWLFLPIGLGSVAGDLANSYVKRQLDIKDWSRAIPGHGGFTDRLSSLASSAALTFYFLKLSGF